jgi:hypothetical protein
MSQLKTACIKVNQETLDNFRLSCVESGVKMSPTIADFMRSYTAMQKQVTFNEAVYALREKLAEDSEALALLDQIVYLYTVTKAD